MRIGCLHNLPRVSLGHSPTPIDEMPNLSRALSQDVKDLHLLIKRDDCTGLDSLLVVTRFDNWSFTWERRLPTVLTPF